MATKPILIETLEPIFLELPPPSRDNRWAHRADLPQPEDARVTDRAVAVLAEG